MKKYLLSIFCVFLVILLNTTYSFACTRVLLDNKYGVNIGRNMDWSDADNAKHKLLVLPRGIERNGEIKDNPIKWKSKYGSLVMTMYNMVTVGGINEKGFNVEVLYLPGSDYGERDTKVPGMFVGMFNQFLLDNFATVSDAISYLKKTKLELVTVILPGSDKPTGLHFALADKTGNSAFIEYVHGKIVIYEGKKYKVLTNQPEYSKQLDNLKKYKGYGGDLAIPGGSTPSDRFVRATYYLDLAIENNTSSKNYKMLSGIMGNSAQLNVKNVKPDALAGAESSATSYISISDLTNMKMYVSFLENHNAISVNIKQLDFSKNAKEKIFDLEKNRLQGDITDKFIELNQPFKFLNYDNYLSSSIEERKALLSRAG